MAHVGVRTRARTLAATSMSTTSSTASKRRKLDNEEQEISISVATATATSAVTPHRPRTSVVVAPETPACSSATGSDHASASCCSSNVGWREKFEEEGEESVEFQTSAYDSGGQRRETTPSSEVEGEELSDDLESTARPSPEATLRLSSTSAEKMAKRKMPADEEIEAFFAEAERVLHKQFVEKYNFDVVKGEPMEGRYEWVRINP